MNKANITAPTLMTIGVMLSVFIVMGWFISNLNPLQHANETMRMDIAELKKISNNACTSVKYQNTYNPRTEKGTIQIYNKTVCIESADVENCDTLLCTFNNTLDVDLGDIVYFVIKKNETELNIFTDITYEEE